MKKWIGLLLGMLLLAGCGMGSEATTEPVGETPLSFQEGEDEVVAESVIEPARWSALGFKTAGEVIEVLVEEGDAVETGDLLIRLDSTDAQLAVKQAAAALEGAQAQLALLRAGARPEEIAAAEAQLEAAKAAVTQAAAQRDQLIAGATEAEISAAKAQVAAALSQQRVARNAHDDTMKCQEVTLPGGGTREICPALGRFEEEARYNLHAADESLAAAQAQLDNLLAGPDADQVRAAGASVSAATAQQDAMQAQLDLVQAGPTVGEIAVAEAEVARAQAALESAEAAVGHTEVRAPFAGTVTAVNVEVGNTVGPGLAACVLATLDQLQARTTDLTEMDIVQVTVGQSAIVALDALPGQEFTGVVRQIALQAEDFRGEVVYAVIIELTDVADTPLRWGMTAWVEFELP
ncbi:MAG: efflux RND transporter periplasmic adaptor subunit [Chloroflexi bacterium]|nr:efflux RND transporter periplasmic adaptor subunit [Chloroflexota bacterium]